MVYVGFTCNLAVIASLLRAKTALLKVLRDQTFFKISSFKEYLVTVYWDVWHSSLENLWFGNQINNKFLSKIWKVNKISILLQLFWEIWNENFFLKNEKNLFLQKTSHNQKNKHKIWRYFFWIKIFVWEIFFSKMFAKTFSFFLLLIQVLKFGLLLVRRPGMDLLLKIRITRGSSDRITISSLYNFSLLFRSFQKFISQKVNFVDYFVKRFWAGMEKA